MARSIISFPQSAVARSSDISSPEAFFPPANCRHRGLFLVTADNVLQTTAIRSTPDRRRRTTQAQADRIVAQVEREIARKAFQQHQAKMGQVPTASTANLLTLPVAKPESAASVARRLLAALFSFAMPA